MVSRCTPAIGCALVLAGACGAPTASLQLEDFVHVGVDPVTEAAAVEAQLVESGYVRVARADEGPRWVALSFERADGRRAVRVVSSRGVVASLDSHESDGVRVRHGEVGLAETPAVDVDGDGDAELVLTRTDGELRCLAVLRLADDGRATSLADDADALAPGACVSALEDVDGDGRPEAIVALRWPELSLGGAPPSLRAAMAYDDGGFRAGAIPIDYLRAERAARETSLEAARAQLDVSSAARLGVELAALAHLEGAAIAAQAGRFDAALSGLVLTETQLARVRAVRAVIGRGWRPPDE